LGKKRDKSDRKKAEIGSILYAGEGLGSFRPFKKKKKHAKRKHNSQEDETSYLYLMPNTTSLD
jgi:hypothetical protein